MTERNILDPRTGVVHRSVHPLNSVRDIEDALCHVVLFSGRWITARTKPVTRLGCISDGA